MESSVFGVASSEEDEDALISSDVFRMFSFKVKQCTKARPHDWCSCPFAHPGEKAKRRDPLLYTYSGTACPEFRRNGLCRRGDSCPFAHGVFECWLHPTRYRTQMCSDGQNCKRRICFFAHDESQLREPEDDPLQQQLQAELSAGAFMLGGQLPLAQQQMAFGQQQQPLYAPQQLAEQIQGVMHRLASSSPGHALSQAQVLHLLQALSAPQQQQVMELPHLPQPHAHTYPQYTHTQLAQPYQPEYAPAPPGLRLPGDSVPFAGREQHFIDLGQHPQLVAQHASSSATQYRREQPRRTISEQQLQMAFRGQQQQQLHERQQGQQLQAAHLVQQLQALQAAQQQGASLGLGEPPLLHHAASAPGPHSLGHLQRLQAEVEEQQQQQQQQEALHALGRVSFPGPMAHTSQPLTLQQGLAQVQLQRVLSQGSMAQGQAGLGMQAYQGLPCSGPDELNRSSPEASQPAAPVHATAWVTVPAPAASPPGTSPSKAGLHDALAALQLAQSSPPQVQAQALPLLLAPQQGLQAAQARVPTLEDQHEGPLRLPLSMGGSSMQLGMGPFGGGSCYSSSAGPASAESQSSQTSATSSSAMLLAGAPPMLDGSSRMSSLTRMSSSATSFASGSMLSSPGLTYDRSSAEGLAHSLSVSSQHAGGSRLPQHLLKMMGGMPGGSGGGTDASGASGSSSVWGLGEAAEGAKGAGAAARRRGMGPDDAAGGLRAHAEHAPMPDPGLDEEEGKKAHATVAALLAQVALGKQQGGAHRASP